MCTICTCDNTDPWCGQLVVCVGGGSRVTHAVAAVLAVTLQGGHPDAIEGDRPRAIRLPQGAYTAEAMLTAWLPLPVNSSAQSFTNCTTADLVNIRSRAGSNSVPGLGIFFFLN